MAGLEALHFQAQSLGYSMLYFLPLLGFIALVSSLSLTNWETAVPTYNPNLFFGALFSLMIGGFVAFVTGASASNEVNPVHGPKAALRVGLPFVSATTTVVVVLFVGVPQWIGVDPHFHLLDLFGFLLAASLGITSFLVGLKTFGMDFQSGRYSSSPPPHASSRRSAVSGHRKKYRSFSAQAAAFKRKTNQIFTSHLSFVFSLLAVILAYPLAIIPFYCSDALNDYHRLIFCLLIHPVMLELVLHKCRGDTVGRHRNQIPMYRGPLPPEVISRRHLHHTHASTPFITEAVFVFYRRFMLSLMRDHTVTNVAIVLTAVEEGATRATVVIRDRFFRRLSGKGDYSPEELDQQRQVWAAQAGNSMLIETVAIFVHAATIYFFLPHRFVFNLGYGGTEEQGVAASVILVNMLFELTCEIVTDTVALGAEKAHGLPLRMYFELLDNTWKVLAHFGSLVCVTGVMLWTFSRIPSAIFCTSNDPCSCFSSSSLATSSNFEIYRDICSTCTAAAAVNSSREEELASAQECTNLTGVAKERFSADADIDADILTQIGFALFAITSTSALAFGVIQIMERRRAQRRVEAASLQVKNQGKELKDLRIKSEIMKAKLAAAQFLVEKVMASETTTLLLRWQIQFEELETHEEIGSGSYGSVFKGCLRGTHEVAIKMVRVAKINEETLAKFKKEILASQLTLLLHESSVSFIQESAAHELHLFLHFVNAQIMCPLQHVNVVQLFGGVWNEGADKLCVVLEFCSNGTLISFLSSQESSAWQSVRRGLALGIGSALRYLHHDLNEPLIHRDVKPENILVTTSVVAKLADFGESTHFSVEKSLCREVDALSMTIAGTRLYAAPEVITGKPYNESAASEPAEGACVASFVVAV